MAAALIFLNKPIIDPSTQGEVDTALVSISNVTNGYPRFTSIDIGGGSDSGFISLGTINNVGIIVAKSNIACVIHDIDGTDLAAGLAAYVRQGYIDLT